MTVLEDETDPSYQREADKIKQAREDLRIDTLRNNIFAIIKGVVELWSADAAIAQVLLVTICMSDNYHDIYRL
jgi:hypothetical protein